MFPPVATISEYTEIDCHHKDCPEQIEEDPVGLEVEAGSWRPITPWDRKSNPGLVGLTLSDGELLLHLLRHYPFIVHFGVTFWRKILIMLHREPEGSFRPCLRGTKYTNSSEYGMLGSLNQVSLFLPKDFLESRQKLTSMRVRCQNDRAGEFDSFFSWAIRNNQLDVVAILMKQLNIKLGQGVWDGWWPPLQLAATHGHKEMVRYFISQGAKVDMKSSGWAPLHDAAHHGHDEVVRLLLDEGADLESKGQNDQTPLHHAALSGHAGVTRTLVQHGADIDVKCKRGRTPLQHAERRYSPTSKIIGVLSPMLSPTTSTEYPTGDWSEQRTLSAEWSRSRSGL